MSDLGYSSAGAAGSSAAGSSAAGAAGSSAAGSAGLGSGAGGAGSSSPSVYQLTYLKNNFNSNSRILIGCWERTYEYVEGSHEGSG